MIKNPNRRILCAALLIVRLILQLINFIGGATLGSVTTATDSATSRVIANTQKQPVENAAATTKPINAKVHNTRVATARETIQLGGLDVMQERLRLTGWSV